MVRHTALLLKLEHEREHFERALEEFEDMSLSNNSPCT